MDNEIKTKPIGILGTMRRVMRLKHMSYSTEKTYVYWARFFLVFNKNIQSKDLRGEHIVEFLSFLANERKVASSTQNQALNALVFLYREVLKKDPEQLAGIQWAKRTRRLPVVMSIQEVSEILSRLKGVQWTIACLLYGTGMRLAEVLGLRVKDVDFERNMILVRDSKGNKDRIVQLPAVLREPLMEQLVLTKKRHELDISEGFGRVSLPGALLNKYPNADREFIWQFVFPSTQRSRDPVSGDIKRHHLYESILHRSLVAAVHTSGINKRITSHAFRHAYATHLLDDGTDIRTLQVLLGHSDVKTTMIYTHVTLEKGVGTKSPLDKIHLKATAKQKN